MKVHAYISRGCFVVSMCGVCLAGCDHQRTASDQDGNRELQGKWKEAGINLDKSMPRDESNLVGVMFMFEPGQGAKTYSFTANELVVTDSMGAEIHRWPYVLKDSLLIYDASDTAMVRWKSVNAFTAYSHGVSVSYERLPGEGR